MNKQERNRLLTYTGRFAGGALSVDVSYDTLSRLLDHCDALESQLATAREALETSAECNSCMACRFRSKDALAKMGEQDGKA